MAGETDFENQKVTIGTVLKWGASLITAALIIGGVVVKTSEKLTVHDEKIRNLEDHVVWRGQ